MSISDSYQPIVQQGNGATVDYPGNWPVFNASYIRVALQDIATGIQTPQVLNTDFTLTFQGNAFNVQFIVPPPNTDYVVISRLTPLTQEAPYKTSQGFQGYVLEGALDKLTAIIQEKTDAIDRSLKFQIGSTLSDYVIDEPINGRGLKWDTVNQRIINTTYDPDQSAEEADAAAQLAIVQAGIATSAASAAENSANAAAAAAANLPLNNYSGSGAPTVNDDIDDGYSIGSIWVDLTASPREAYICLNNLSGAAVWVLTTLDVEDLGSAAFLDVGTSIGNVVQLQNVGGNPSLPPVDGSQLLGVSSVIVKRDYAQITTLVTCTTTMPQDDTIPQITEGDEILSKSFTMTDSANRLRITVSIPICAATAMLVGIALFNGGSNAIAAAPGDVRANLAASTITIIHEFLPATGSPVTYSVRAGGTGTVYVNGRGAARTFGGVCMASMIFEEIKP